MSNFKPIKFEVCIPIDWETYSEENSWKYKTKTKTMAWHDNYDDFMELFHEGECSTSQIEAFISNQDTKISKLEEQLKNSIPKWLKDENQNN